MVNEEINIGTYLSIFGQRLASQRKNLNMTQAELAKKVGTTQKVQSGYERGQVAPKIDYLLKLSGLGFDVALLIDGASRQLSAREETVLDLYRVANTETQLKVLEILASGGVKKFQGDTTIKNVARVAGIQTFIDKKNKY